MNVEQTLPSSLNQNQTYLPVTPKTPQPLFALPPRKPHASAFQTPQPHSNPAAASFNEKKKKLSPTSNNSRHLAACITSKYANYPRDSLRRKLAVTFFSPNLSQEVLLAARSPSALAEEEEEEDGGKSWYYAQMFRRRVFASHLKVGARRRGEYFPAREREV